MVLAPQEESLISVIRLLSPDEAEKVFCCARQLGDLAGGGPIQWSDAWSDDDLTDAINSTLRGFDDSEQKER